MGYIYTNPNPKGAITGDCVVRAVAIANDLDWDTAYLILSGYSENDGYHHDAMSYARGRGTYANRDSMGRYAEDDRYPERYR